MPTLLKPDRETMREFRDRQSGLTCSYAAIGATATSPPPGFVVDRTRIRLGSGESVFRAAVAALRRWEQFQLGWVQPWPTDVPHLPGEVVTVLARASGLWWLNACRIVYVVDETGATCRSGFAYGTLPGHAEMGEERFLIEWNRSDDSVWYDILAYSRPNHWLAWLGYPLARRLQKRFGRDSAAAMRRAVSTG